MASVLALISKSIYEQLQRDRSRGYGRYQLGDVVALDRYASKHAAFDQLAADDAIFLVTVRPKGLLLVAVLDHPERKGGALIGATNRTPLVFIDKALRQLRLADGKGITAPLAKLGMSLQTPRVLAEADVALLRRAAPASRAVKSDEVVMVKVPAKPPAAARTKGAPALRGGELGPRAKALVAQIYQHPHDPALRGVLADQLLQDQHVWGELISLQLGSRHAARVAQIFKQHARDIVGDIANVAAREAIELVDGFPHRVMCAKSKTFTSAEERHTAAIAPQWATVRTVKLTGMMTGVFVRELLHNPASANLTRIEDGGWRRVRPCLTRAKASDPWQLVNAGSARVLDGLPDDELARIPPPATPALVAALAEARARRVKQAAKPAPTSKSKSKPKSKSKSKSK